MPVYFFNVRNGTGDSIDEEGQEYADDEAARMAGIRGIRSILAAELVEGVLDLAGRLEATDSTGEILFTIRFADAVELRERDVESSLIEVRTSNQT